VATIDWLRDVAASTFARGEFLVVEPGGWDATDEPYALAAAVKMQDEWALHVEAKPPVTGSTQARRQGAT
jgi:hypothetical protein